uniref:Uncharacterized protein n=1 Tax=Siphoviridae sp. ctETl1 TaxID=2826207 RepID=A0A8S5QUH3_9CAUD|nr:MAG TPA: hypothetical protein [Siphoviridae sp. ctETl1]
MFNNSTRSPARFRAGDFLRKLSRKNVRNTAFLGFIT